MHRILEKERHGYGMNTKRVMIAAPKSGSGKTIVTCALLWALKSKGWKVVSCKCGPDYIDPMFHEKVIGIPSENLDTFFTGEGRTRELLFRHTVNSDFAVLEGVMGLYDGLGGVREEGSSYHLAKITETPVILVIDAKGMGRSLVSLIAGFLAYDREHLIRGVLLNRISKGYYEVVKPLIEEELKIPVTGFLPEREEWKIESRYLGLRMPGEEKDIRERLQAVSEEFKKNVSIENIINIAGSAAKPGTDRGPVKTEQKTDGKGGRKTDGPVIAVARDEAFCFYYRDNLLLLEESGAKIRYFSPLRDEKLPERCHGLLLGGGYPELFAGRLSENSKIRTAIRKAVENGMPVVAECGGFMYLHSSLTDKEGVSYDMAGVIPGTCFYTGKAVRFGYVEIQEKKSYFLPKDGKIKGHEFHYYDSTCNGEDAVAVKPVTGREYSCMIEGEMRWMGFPHLYYPSNPDFAKAFVEKAQRYKKGMAQE